MIDETAFAAYNGNSQYIVTVLADGEEKSFLIKADFLDQAVSRISRNLDANDFGTISCERV